MALTLKDGQPASRTERRKARTAQGILAAAERLFLVRGYRSTTVDELADEADVALGTLYAHFGGKDGVYAALVDHALELDRRYCDEGFASGATPLERLVGLSEGYLHFAREHPAHFRVFRFPPLDVPSGGPVGEAGERVAGRLRAEVTRMSGALAEAIAEGLVRPVEPRRAAVFLWSAWDGVIAAHVLPGNMGLEEREFEEVLELAREVLTLGLLAPAEGRS